MEGSEGVRLIWERLAWAAEARPPGPRRRAWGLGRQHEGESLYLLEKLKVFIAAMGRGTKEMKHKHSRNSKPQGKTQVPPQPWTLGLCPVLPRPAWAPLCARLEAAGPGGPGRLDEALGVLEGSKGWREAQLSWGMLGRLGSPGLSDFCLVRSSQLRNP